MLIVARDEWGSKSNIQRVVLNGELPLLFIHHTAGHFPKNSAEEIQQMGILQHIAIDIDKISDLPYNWLIGPSGTVYEGRGLHYKSAATLDQNDFSRSICFMGNFMNDIPTQLSLDTCRQLINTLKLLHDLAPNVTVYGHRDNPKHLNATECPGNFLYSHIKELNNTVGGDDMLKPRLIRQKGFANVLLIDYGSPVTLSEEMLTSYTKEDSTIEKIFQDHMPSFRSLCRMAGLADSDLVTGGPTDKF